MRRAAAEEAGREVVATAWDEWTLGVQHWFRSLCLGIDLEPSAALPIQSVEDLQDAQFRAEDQAAEGGGEGEDSSESQPDGA